MKMPGAAAIVVAGALAIAACSSQGTSGPDTSLSLGGTSPGDPTSGQTLYAKTCTACHRGDLSGITGLGKPLAPSAFIAELSEEDLAAFIAAGRSTDDPTNTTGVDMPPRGGNAALSAQDLRDIAAFLKTEQEEPGT